MSDILIKGMEMPTNEPLLVKINPDGSVSKLWRDVFLEYANCKVVPVPPHGRLIDADKFRNIKYELPDGQKAFNRGFHSGVQYVQRMIMDAPTVIEAEESE